MTPNHVQWPVAEFQVARRSEGSRETEFLKARRETTSEERLPASVGKKKKQKRIRQRSDFMFGKQMSVTFISFGRTSKAKAAFV